MFFRLKTSGPRAYLQIVENRREDGAHRQHGIATPGRADELAATGGLDALLASGARLRDEVMLPSALAGEAGGPRLSTRRIGAPLLFGRLWEETGCRAVLAERLAGRGFAFAVERAVFATVLHRIMVSGSGRACERWMEDYAIPGVEELQLHHLYRAMAWLGEELDAGGGGQDHATPFAPRTVKDLVEERLFERRRDLFADLPAVFLDTTSPVMTGQGGEALGRRGYSTRLTPLQAVLQYRRLRVVEDLFRTATSILRTRPVFHSSDAAIRGRVFCSFLALVPRDELLRRCRAAGLKPEWGDVLRDLDRLQRGTIEQGGKTWRVRTEGGATAAALLRACGIAVPPRIQGIPPPAVDPPNPAPLPESRGRPRRGATRS